MNIDQRNMRQLFSTGQIVATPGALDLGINFVPFILRHIAGDWGELDKHDVAENNLSVKEGFRILSAYRAPGGKKFWIITEADRSSTTVLLPDEY